MGSEHEGICISRSGLRAQIERLVTLAQQQEIMANEHAFWSKHRKWHAQKARDYCTQIQALEALLDYSRPRPPA